MRLGYGTRDIRSSWSFVWAASPWIGHAASFLAYSFSPNSIPRGAIVPSMFTDHLALGIIGLLVFVPTGPVHTSPRPLRKGSGLPYLVYFPLRIL